MSSYHDYLSTAMREREARLLSCPGLCGWSTNLSGILADNQRSAELRAHLRDCAKGMAAIRLMRDLLDFARDDLEPEQRYDMLSAFLYPDVRAAGERR
jgi:hypothetical protein